MLWSSKRDIVLLVHLLFEHRENIYKREPSRFSSYHKRLLWVRSVDPEPPEHIFCELDACIYCHRWHNFHFISERLREVLSRYPVVLRSLFSIVREEYNFYFKREIFQYCFVEIFERHIIPSPPLHETNLLPDDLKKSTIHRITKSKITCHIYWKAIIDGEYCISSIFLELFELLSEVGSHNNHFKSFVKIRRIFSSHELLESFFLRLPPLRLALGNLYPMISVKILEILLCFCGDNQFIVQKFILWILPPRKKEKFWL